MYALSNLTTNTWGSNGYVTRDLYGIVGGLSNALNKAGGIGTTWATNYENNTSGANPFSDLMGLLAGYGKTGNSFIGKGSGYVSAGGNFGRDVYGQGVNIGVMLDRFGAQGSSLSERWKNMFHPNSSQSSSEAPRSR